MKGSFYRRGCKCGKKKCTCGSKWAFTIDIGPDPKTGKRRQKTKSGFKTLKDAEEVATDLIYDLKQGTFILENNILFKDFALQWLSMYCEEREVKPGTIRVRKHEIDKLMPYLGYLKVKDINSNKYKQVLNTFKRCYSDKTVDGIHRTGRMIFKKAIEMEYIKKDPTQYVVLQRKKKSIEELGTPPIPKYMEKQELALFLETAAKHGLEIDYSTFLTLSYTGIRVGELVSLQWKDIDFENKCIRIIKTCYNPRNNTVQYMLVTPKTTGSIRTIAVEDNVIEVLKNHKKEQDKVKNRIGGSYFDNDFVFANTKKHPGYPILIKTVENRMKRLLKLAGLSENLTPHSLRHTHTSLLAEAKVVLEDIMERLGHSDDDTTRNIYRHVTEEMKKEASQKFGQLMRSLQ